MISYFLFFVTFVYKYYCKRTTSSGIFDNQFRNFGTDKFKRSKFIFLECLVNFLIKIAKKNLQFFYVHVTTTEILINENRK